MFRVYARTYERKHSRKSAGPEPPTQGLHADHAYTVYEVLNHGRDFLIWDPFYLVEVPGDNVRDRKPGGWRRMGSYLFEPATARRV